MKAIVVRQPWATLIAVGTKTIETRPAPPNGPMRPDGVRGLPGCSLERGERIAIVAGARRPVRHGDHYGEWRLSLAEPDPVLHSLSLPYRFHPLPLGAVVCTVTVDDALPIAPIPPPAGDASPPDGLWVRDDRVWGKRLWITSDGNTANLSDQLPLGDFTPGRWGWLLSDPQPPTEPCGVCAAVQSWDAAVAHGMDGCPAHGCVAGRVHADPIPCTGRQGVFELPADIAEILS